MKSNHAFDLQSCFPASAEPGKEFASVTYSNVAFREPESRADQTRMMSIVTTAADAGYYVDVFRSRKERGGDKMHDYFYHNLGQTLTLTAADGSDLNLQPTEELAFAGAHLYAYSYLYDKKMVATGKDVKATFRMTMKEGDDISMNLWMKGEPEREVFTALAPMTEGLSRTPGMPYNIKEQPTLTFVARQHGEAWNRPFVAIYEPSSVKEPSSIRKVSYFDAAEQTLTDFAGICVENKSGRIDHIFSLSDCSKTVTYQDMQVRADYALVSNEYAENRTLFLGNGTLLKASGVNIFADKATNVLLEKKNGEWYVTASAPCTVVIGKKKVHVGTTVHSTLLFIQ
ncbi:hypothetical protein JCM10512_3110 [Bacteroides reticulotermitis JCM 10512]|uniref:Endo-acting ulvan lyase C-terminal domain-containing protein n=2 Tax=Bacteroides reticulotermitis TaxID=1133319 RepID=W4UV92_9BACE|nr:hypothetical protein JCM10512_3110 [Bacteroides reticulotermitis JCM 10512]